MKNDAVPAATAARLPLYVRRLRELARNRVELASSRKLADTTGLEAHQIRKDLSYLGTFGKRGVGYQVDDLLEQLSSYLSLSRVWRVALVGYGRLGSAIACHLTLLGNSYHLSAVFDCSYQKIGSAVEDLEVLSWRQIPLVSRQRGIDMAILATPPLAAQGVADLLVEGGVKLLLNFTAAQIAVPGDCTVRNVDLSAEMQALALQHTARKPLRTREHARAFAGRGAS